MNTVAKGGRPFIYDELFAAFDAMEVGDCLRWDVDNISSAANQLYLRAKDNKVTVTIRSPNGLGAKQPGRLFVMRYV